MTCMRIFQGMAFTDRIVFLSLQELIAERGEDAVISQNDIAEYTGMALSTTQYALRRLIKNGYISGDFTIGVGYKYRINNGSNPPAARRAAAPRTA